MNKKFGQINFNSSFLNSLIEEEFRIFTSRLFHAVVASRKKESLKNVSYHKTRDIVTLETSCSIDIRDTN